MNVAFVSSFVTSAISLKLRILLPVTCPYFTKASKLQKHLHDICHTLNTVKHPYKNQHSNMKFIHTHPNIIDEPIK